MSNSNYIWHPFTQMKSASPPIHIVKGEGALLYDANGKTYIDAISSWWTNIHGHAHPYIAQKIYEQALQLEHVIFAGFTHTPALELATRLIENHLPPTQKKIFFSDNGSTAVEVAIKMALQFWFNTGSNRKKIIAFENAYHGDTFGSMSVSARSTFTHPFNHALFDVLHIPAPYPGAENVALEKMEEILTLHNDIAAFIYEPLVQGAAGMLMYAPEQLDKLIALAKTQNIITIADEVMTGFYRTGKMFAINHCTQAPDIMCLSKGLTGGTMALGITACTQEIFDAFYSTDVTKALYHGHSYTANPIACTSALASLDLIEKELCALQVNNITEQHTFFAETLRTIPPLKNIRQTGTVLAFDINTDERNNYFSEIKNTIYPKFIDAGVLLRPLGNTVYIMPPYCITAAQLQQVYESIMKILA